MKHTCSICGATHNRFKDRAHRQPASYCKSCHAMHMRTHRPKHRDLPEKARRRANARAYAGVALRRGKLTRMPCELCGDPASQMHHDDYAKPLAVRWLCRACHLAHHRT